MGRLGGQDGEAFDGGSLENGYVNELAARKNDRDEDTLEHMEILARSMLGKHMRYRELIEPNGLSNYARRPKRQRKAATRPKRKAAKPKRRATRTREGVDTRDSAVVVDLKINGRRAS